MYDELAKLKGAAIDRAYARVMVRDHESGIKKFQKGSQQELEWRHQSFATKTLPTLQDHL